MILSKAPNWEPQKKATPAPRERKGQDQDNTADDEAVATEEDAEVEQATPLELEASETLVASDNVLPTTPEETAGDSAASEQ